MSLTSLAARCSPACLCACVCASKVCVGGRAGGREVTGPISAVFEIHFFYRGQHVGVWAIVVSTRLHQLQPSERAHVVFLLIGVGLKFGEGTGTGDDCLAPGA